MAKKKEDTAVATRDPKAGAVAPAQEDVSQGGIGAEDFEIGRALVLQKTSPDVEQGNGEIGTIINNLSKDKLGDYFIPMLAFKQYAKFAPDNGPLEWSTRDRTDPRVVEGLKWKDGEKPEVTEFINLFVVFKSDPFNPIVLSFKRGSMKAGKQFLSLLEMKRRAGKQWHECVYKIALHEKMKGNNKYFTPVVTPTSEEKDGDNAKIDSQLLENCKQFAQYYGPTFKNMDLAKASDKDGEDFNDQF